MADRMQQFVQNGQLTKDPNLKAPVYNDPFFDFNGETYQNAFATDPALAMTLGAGGQGAINKGIGAFLQPNAAQTFNAAGQNVYDKGQLEGLANMFGYTDPNAYKDQGLQSYLDDKLKDYYAISGLSAGWNPTGNMRGANNTIYKREDGKLQPYYSTGYNAPEKGSWLQENPEFGYVMSVIGAGAGAMLGAAGSAGSGAATGGAAGGSTGAAGAAGSSGLSGLWSSLPSWGQGAITGAAQGGLNSAMTGQNPLTGALLGGLTGGVAPVASGALTSATGMPSWASNALVGTGMKAAMNGGIDENQLLGSLATGAAGAAGGQLGTAINPSLGALGNNVGSLIAQSALTGRAPGINSLAGLFRNGVNAYQNYK